MIYKHTCVSWNVNRDTVRQLIKPIQQSVYCIPQSGTSRLLNNRCWNLASEKIARGNKTKITDSGLSVTRREIFCASNFHICISYISAHFLLHCLHATKSACKWAKDFSSHVSAKIHKYRKAINFPVVCNSKILIALAFWLIENWLPNFSKDPSLQFRHGVKETIKM